MRETAGSGLILRSALLARVSKDGRLDGRSWPSFETQRYALLLRMRANNNIGKIGLPT